MFLANISFDIVTGVWLFVFIAAIIIEIETPNLTTIWFAAGAFITMLLSLFTEIDTTFQIIVFIVVSFALIFTLRKWSHRLLKSGNNVKTNIDEAIGKEVIVTKDVSEYENGECLYNNIHWTIKSKNGDLIKKGAIVVIIDVEGNKFIVVKKGGR